MSKKFYIKFFYTIEASIGGYYVRKGVYKLFSPAKFLKMGWKLALGIFKLTKLIS